MEPKDYYKYFIITAEHKPGGQTQGKICYIYESRYSSVKRAKKDTLPVKYMGDVLDSSLPSNILQPLTTQKAEFLLALDTNEDRLQEFARAENLDQAVNLKVGSEVKVEKNGEWLSGIVRYIGKISSPNSIARNPIAGAYFGVELQGEDRRKGHNDGTFGHRTLFKCEKNCGIFAPFNRIKPVNQTPSAPPQPPCASLPESPAEQLQVGERVTYFVDDKRDGQHGMVLKVMYGEGMVLISTDMDEHGKVGGEITVPLQTVLKEKDLLEEVPEKMDRCKSTDITPVPDVNTAISVGSKVEVQFSTGPAYGIVRWTGRLPGKTENMAGLELEDERGVNDGTFQGARYFKCPAKRGLFVKVSSCHPDSRFLGENAVNGYFDHDGKDTSALQLNIPPITSENVKNVLTGRMKGIQGHCNSCYMDSALFSLFSCSSVLDSLLFKKTKRNDEHIQKILLRDIVCPLRSKGFVAKCNVMNLRKQLQDRGHCPSYTTDEKDPEEFLTLIMQNILSLEPLLKLQSCNQHKAETEMEETPSYFYQIFMDYNNSLILPSVQQLLEHSFHNNSLRLTEVPSCLILTMPRSGKNFKMFPKIIPSLELDITALLSSGPQQCVLCGQLACVECVQCFEDSVFSNTGFKFFCDICSAQVHCHPSRRSHKPATLQLPEGFSLKRGLGDFAQPPPREKLELFAVLCIETSHYVSFVKYGPKITDWIFFDSMADRQGEIDGFNIPEVKACPEVARYLSMPLAELAKKGPREMEDLAKRLFCDGYMYLYQSPSMALYR